MNTREMVKIHFILNNEIVLYLNAYHTPMIGDEARIDNTIYIIARVCWCYDEDCSYERMNCEITKVEEGGKK